MNPTTSSPEPLLRTKLTPPPGRQDLIPRARLFRQFEEGVSLPVTLVTAPAGSGKTSLLRSWRMTPKGASAKLAWLALDIQDNGPIRFWRYIAAALNSCLEDNRQLSETIIDAADLTAIEPGINRLLNSLAGAGHGCILALDDYHLINSPTIHESMTYFIERLPPGVHVVLLTRADPPLPLARWRVRGMLHEIRLRDLRFTTTEVHQLYQSKELPALSDEDIARLNMRTEGWAAGLHLAALALRGREDAEDFIGSFSGSHRFVLTYLIDEVLDALPESVETFLLQTSILNGLCGSLCDAVTGRTDSTQLLTELEAGGFFISPLDDVGDWYRYHHLFADVLRHYQQQKMSGMTVELNVRAARWCEQQEMIEQAIEYFARANYLDDTTRLIRDFARPHEAAIGAETIDRWLAHLPPHFVASNPELGIIRAWSRLVIGPIDHVESTLLEAERAIDANEHQDADALRGEIAAIRSMVASFTGDIERTISEASYALNSLPVERVEVRGIVSMGLGQAHRFAGNLAEAEGAYWAAIELGLQAGNFYAAIDSASDLGLVLMRLGRLRDAEALYRRARNVLAQHGAEDGPVSSSLAVIQPELLRERNLLDEALEMVEGGIALGHHSSKMDILITGYRALGTIQWARGETDHATQSLDTARSLALEYGLLHTARGIELVETQMRMTNGDTHAAEVWLRDFHADPALPGSVQEAEQLLLARALIATGSPSEASMTLERLLNTAYTERREGDVIRLLAVQACAHAASGDSNLALETLGRALDLAEPEGYVRVFLDEGAPMLELLHRSERSANPHSYASVLLEQSEPASEPCSRGSRTNIELLEPLTERELAVLRLLKGRLSGPEIARELFVAPSTVRSHMKSIYRKLDVHSRDQAIVRARELEL